MFVAIFYFIYHRSPVGIILLVISTFLHNFGCDVGIYMMHHFYLINIVYNNEHKSRNIVVYYYVDPVRISI